MFSEHEHNLSFLERPSRFAVEAMLLPPPGATQLRELIFPPEAVFQRFMKEPGQTLTGKADQLDHIGCFVVRADTAAEAHQKGMDARRRAILNGNALEDNPNNILAFSEFVGDSRSQSVS